MASEVVDMINSLRWTIFGTTLFLTVVLVLLDRNFKWGLTEPVLVLGGSFMVVVILLSTDYDFVVT